MNLCAPGLGKTVKEENMREDFIWQLIDRRARRVVVPPHAKMKRSQFSVDLVEQIVQRKRVPSESQSDRMNAGSNWGLDGCHNWDRPLLRPAGFPCGMRGSRYYANVLSERDDLVSDDLMRHERHRGQEDAAANARKQRAQLTHGPHVVATQSSSLRRGA